MHIKFIESSFIAFSNLIYKIIHLPMAISCVILLLLSLIMFGNFKFIQSVHKKRTNKAALMFEIILILIEGYLFFFTIWYLVIHIKPFLK